MKIVHAAFALALGLSPLSLGCAGPEGGALGAGDRPDFEPAEIAEERALLTREAVGFVVEGLEPFGGAAEGQLYRDDIERLDVARAWNLGHFHPCLPEERALMQYCP